MSTARTTSCGARDGPGLLAAARRRLERTGGTLDGDIGLARPGEAERRTVIGITGRYRPETAQRLAVPLRDLDAYLHDRYGTGLLTTLVCERVASMPTRIA
ncbi:hypothetical protein AB0H69_48090 [Streptomyces phaeochromogenes]|uniref:hypothetical protein n=1 Tax=Streptomyces phaeochromogenes TaxID=1923 RepID=UPI003401F365